MPGFKGWLTDPWGSLKKTLTNSFSGEVPVACGSQNEEHIRMGFIGNSNAKMLIIALERYNEDVSSKDASGSYARDKGAISFNKKVIRLLKMYRKELENFKEFDFFASSTLKRLEVAKKKMGEILKQLQADSKTALGKYSDEPMRKAALENDELKSYVPKRIWCDFMIDMVKDIEFTRSNLDNVINLKKPEIKFKDLQIADIKTRVGKNDIKRKEVLEKNIVGKLKKDAEFAHKKVEGYLKEATTIHKKIKAVYDKMISDRRKISDNVSTENAREDIDWELIKFNNNTLVPICRLVGLTCCKFIVGKGAPEPEPGDGGIIELEQTMKEKMPDLYSEAIALLPKAKEKLDEIKKFEKKAQQQIKKTQELIKKTAKIRSTDVE